MADLTPVFILSLPRSGSTLLQRMLMANPAVATVPEPWLLLPLFYARREAGIATEYRQRTASTAVNEFIARLPDEDNDWFEAVRAFAAEREIDLAESFAYGDSADDLPMLQAVGAAHDHARYFLDKTPRYHLIVDELFQAFPDGKFVFLWRNPLAIIASIIETWGRGRWNVDRFEIDLDRGLRALLAARRKFGDRSIAINYEALVREPGATLGQIRDYLGLDGAADELERFGGLDLDGAMGDPVGTRAYEDLSAEPLDKWRRVLANPLRKAWCRRYLARFSREDWTDIGYDRDWLLAELAGVSRSFAGAAHDLWRMTARRSPGGRTPI